MHSFALLGWFGAALSMILPWPQVWRSVAQGRTNGLSATACWQGAAMPVGWITYGILTGEMVQVVTNTVTGLAGLSVLVTVLIKQGELRSGRKLLTSLAGAAAVLTAAAGSALVAVLTKVDGAQVSTFLGTVLAVTAMLSAIPQPLSLLRDRGQDLAGLSPLRWRLAAAACTSWMTYGLLTGQAAVWLSASVGLISALIVCSVLTADSKKTAAQPVIAQPLIAQPVIAQLAVKPIAFARPTVNQLVIAQPTLTQLAVFLPTVTLPTVRIGRPVPSPATVLHREFATA